MSADAVRLCATTVVAGSGTGRPVILTQPLSFWGGYDAAVGRIVEQRHPQAGVSLAGTIVLMPAAKGSSSSSSVLAEAIRNGTGPAAIVMRGRDIIVALGCIVASELYGIDVPIVSVDTTVWDALTTANATALLRVHAEADQAEVTIEGWLP